MGDVLGVHLLPSTGEFTYDTVAYEGQRVGGAMQAINTYYAPGGSKTDYSYAIDQLQAAHPECATVSVVCSWFCDGLTPGANHLYPSTTYIGGAFQPIAGGSDEWRVSGLNQGSPGLIALPTNSGGFVYGGTPSDQSVVRCIRDLKSRGFKVIFYPFVLMTAAGYPWRGSISASPDISSAAASAVDAFLGSAATSQFTPNTVNLTVAYSGSPTDYTFRRMILHYAWLCTVAGGVNLFLIGSELRGLETIRGPAWTPAGTTDGSGHAVWDYPFVAGLVQLANDVRSIFDGQGLTKNLSTLTNLIAYSADWSDWMGFQHPGANGQWPHLDSLWASPNIDFVGFDNYLPLSDWTTGDGGLDAINWLNPPPSGSWPPSASAMNGLGLSGAPSIYSSPYLKANIEGGEKFNWFYDDGNNDGRGLDPNGSDLMVSLPEGDRLAQARNPYYPNQQLLANKQLRWWWNNPHQAIYDDGDGNGWAPHGPATEWTPQSKSIS
ncbi:MAG: glycoside hydrolase TIM-barrel-like domain-containing protein, partial [Roseiarcus sp.]